MRRREGGREAGRVSGREREGRKGGGMEEEELKLIVALSLFFSTCTMYI